MVHCDCKDGPGQSQDDQFVFELKKDTAFEILSDYHRREILHYLQEMDADSAHIDELAERLYRTELETDSTMAHSELLTKLHHVHLPKLEAADYLDYDHETNTVEYEDPQEIELLLAAIDTL